MTKKLYLFYLVGFLLIMLLHLLSVPPLFHPPAFAKSIAFRIIFSVILFVFCYQVLFLDKKPLEKLKNYFLDKKHNVFWPLWLLASLGLIYILSTIFSQDPHFSFFNSPFRGAGSLTYLLLLAFCVFIFLIVKEKDWQKLWDFNILVGVIVSLVAVSQKFSLFSDVLSPSIYRPFSTMGGTTFLAFYLSLLIFPALSFGLERLGKKSIFYFSSIAILIFGILLTAARSSFLGLVIGSIIFLFLYPKKSKRITIIKVVSAAVIVLGILGAFWLAGQEETVERIRNSPVIGVAFNRVWTSVHPLLNVREITFEKVVSSGRYSGWKILWPALTDKPLLGYGPENISIPFDKNYDSTIEGVSSEGKSGGSGWWDRAHNIFLDTGITIGIPGLIIYVLLFALLIIKLQKVNDKRPIVILGIQVTFIIYFIINFFNFDAFSSYLLVFFLIAYSLSLMKKDHDIEAEAPKSSLWKYIAITVLIFILLWFIWSANLKPLMINEGINEAIFLIDRAQCSEALKVIDPLTLEHSYIDNYVRLKYIDIIGICLEVTVDTDLYLSQKAVEILEQAKELRPLYTRSWSYSAIFLNKMIQSDPDLTEEQRKELIAKAFINLEKAQELSPKRIDIYLTWVKTHLLAGEKEKALEKANLCIEINPDSGECYWAKALTLILFGEEKSEETLEYVRKATVSGYTKQAYSTLTQLIVVYENLAKMTQDIWYYEILEELYLIKLQFDDTKFQDHATLAFIYSILGEYDKAREHAEIVRELSPESEENIKEFLKSLPK